MIDLPGCIVFSPGVAKIFHIRKKNYILNNLYLHNKLPIVNSSPSGRLQSLPNSQIWYDFFRSSQFFQIRPDSVLIEMNDINNVIYNNFEYHDQLPKMHCFLSRSL